MLKRRYSISQSDKAKYRYTLQLWTGEKLAHAVLYHEREEAEGDGILWQNGAKDWEIPGLLRQFKRGER